MRIVSMVLVYKICQETLLLTLKVAIDCDKAVSVDFHSTKPESSIRCLRVAQLIFVQFYLLENNISFTNFLQQLIKATLFFAMKPLVEKFGISCLQYIIYTIFKLTFDCIYF